MTICFVTRHPGAREWAESRGFRIDVHAPHLDMTTVEPGDIVMGTLPVNLAAEVQERGARYLHLSLDLPSALRGRELLAEEMEQAGARLEEYRIVRIEPEEPS